jgi:hypothetical protein
VDNRPHPDSNPDQEKPPSTTGAVGADPSRTTSYVARRVVGSSAGCTACPARSSCGGAGHDDTVQRQISGSKSLTVKLLRAQRATRGSYSAESQRARDRAVTAAAPSRRWSDAFATSSVVLRPATGRAVTTDPSEVCFTYALPISRSDVPHTSPGCRKTRMRSKPGLGGRMMESQWS